MPPKLSGAALAVSLLASVSCLAPGPVVGQEIEDLHLAAPLERDALRREVFARNTSLEAARRAYDALTQRVPQATTLDDPRVGYRFGPLSIFDDQVRYGQVIEVSQRIPYPGKLDARGDLARAEASLALEEIDAVRLDLALEASRLFDDYVLVGRRLAVNEEHVSLLTDLHRTATARYAAGLISQHVPLSAEVELAHLQHREVILETEREVIVARLNALLHRPPAAPLPRPAMGAPLTDHPHLGNPLVGLGTEPLTDVGAAEEAAVRRRPEVALARARVEARRAAVRVAELAFKPDLDVGASYNSMWARESHRLMVGASVNVPIRKKRLEAGVAEAEARVAEAESRLAHVEDVIRADVRQAYDRVMEAHHVSELYTSRILPAARDHIEAARIAFETGNAPFLEVVQAEKNLRTSELAYLETLADWSRRRAELARTLGELPPGEAPGAATEIPTGPIGAMP